MDDDGAVHDGHLAVGGRSLLSECAYNMLTNDKLVYVLQCDVVSPKMFLYKNVYMRYCQSMGLLVVIG